MTDVLLTVNVLLLAFRIVQAELAHGALTRLLNDLATLSGDGRDA